MVENHRFKLNIMGHIMTENILYFLYKNVQIILSYLVVWHMNNFLKILLRSSMGRILTFFIIIIRTQGFQHDNHLPYCILNKKNKTSKSTEKTSYWNNLWFNTNNQHYGLLNGLCEMLKPLILINNGDSAYPVVMLC